MIKKTFENLAKNKRGRPSIYTPELGDKICCETIKSYRGLDYICNSDKNLPSPSTVKLWLAKNIYPQFSDDYARAKLSQTYMIDEEILNIAYNAEPHSKNGGLEKDKLKIDALKWIGAHLAPKKWGNKPKNEEEDAPKKMTEDDLKDKLVSILTHAQERIN